VDHRLPHGVVVGEHGQRRADARRELGRRERHPRAPRPELEHGLRPAVPDVNLEAGIEELGGDPASHPPEAEHTDPLQLDVHWRGMPRSPAPETAGVSGDGDGEHGLESDTVRRVSADALGWGYISEPPGETSVATCVYLFGFATAALIL